MVKTGLAKGGLGRSDSMSKPFPLQVRAGSIAWWLKRQTRNARYRDQTQHSPRHQDKHISTCEIQRQNTCT